MAIWHRWVKVEHMQVLLDSAYRRLEDAKHQWTKVTGPAATLIASCWRVGWKVKDSVEVTNDRGKVIELGR